MTGSCAALAASLSPAQQVGQLFMMGVSSGGLTGRDRDVLADRHVGAVIFLGNSTAGLASTARLSGRVRAAADTPRGIRTLLTVDQEGGRVQRLRGPGFDRIPSAQRQAQQSDRELSDGAEEWGRQLSRAGVDANLAPVADLVPPDLEQVNRPIGLLDRGYGPDPDVIAAKATAFIRGMDRAGIATSVKHFPGLGRVRGNTDFESHVVDETTTRHDPALRGFAAGVRAEVDMVMVSSAYYDRIDPDHRAAFSPVVIGSMIRQDLGFARVVVSDDLAARAVTDLTPGQRALRFLRAGGDLVIVGNSAAAASMLRDVRAEAENDPRFAAEVTAKATRVLALKARRGLTDCG